MEKLSVGETVDRIYRFAFKNYLTLLGITWLPAALMGAVTILAIFPAMGAFAAMSRSRDLAAISGGLSMFALGEIGAMLIMLVLGIGVTRLVLGHKPRLPFVYFSLGADFWRLLLALFLFAIMSFVLLVLLSLVLGVAGGLFSSAQSGAGSSPSAGIAVLVIVLGIYAVMFFLLVRFCMLLPSVVVAERRIGLGRAWALSRGNFWRLCAVALSVFIPVVVVGLVQTSLTTALSGGSMTQAFSSPGAQMAWSQNMARLMTTYAYFYIPMIVLIAPVYYGLFFGAGAFSYRALTPSSSADIVDTF